MKLVKKLSSPVKAFSIYSGNVLNIIHHCKTVALHDSVDPR